MSNAKPIPPNPQQPGGLTPARLLNGYATATPANPGRGSQKVQDHMTKFTLEIDGLSGYGRKSIEATSPRDAIAIYWNHLGPMTVPSETRVYHGKGHEFFGIQQIMDIVAEAQGRKAENYLRLIE